MIAACPKCGARYRIDAARLRPEGVRMRCSRCEAIFRVSPPPPEPAPPAAPPRAQAEVTHPGPPDAGPQAPQAAPQASVVRPPAARSEPPAGTDAEPAVSSERLVLVADPEVQGGKATATAIASWGLQPLLVHDGVEAILAVQRSLPRAVVLDAALPKMFGFQVCELMKRNESLRSIHVVLVGAIHDPERYRRPPSELYGADAYIERPQLPEALRSILHEFGLPIAGGAGAAAPAPAPPHAAPPPARAPLPAPEPPPAPAPAAPEPPPASGVAEVSPAGPVPPAPQPGAEGVDPQEIEKAERLARIVVSDIVLYNQEKFEAAVRSGNVLEALRDELEEGRALFRQRIGEPVREARDFLAEELVRVARQRGSR